MVSSNLITTLILPLVIVTGVLTFLGLRRYIAQRRILEYTGGTTPETLDFGVVFYGYSTDRGRLRPIQGAIFATSDALVFLGLERKSTIVEMPWDRLTGWSVVDRHRGRFLQRKMLSLKINSNLGLPMDLAFAMPRPSFWTHLIDIGIKSGKKG